MNIIDRIISFVSPEAGARRARARVLESIFTDGERKYDGAGRGRRNPRQNPSTSANTEISGAARDLRNNHRDMVRNNPYAKKAVGVIAANVVGNGIKPSIQSTGSRALRAAKSAWKMWADTTACDYEGRKTFPGIQRLVMQSVAESGEVFIRA
ncbi:MAG: phage portal protein, partial [Saprospiraceae bacterium]